MQKKKEVQNSNIKKNLLCTRYEMSLKEKKISWRIICIFYDQLYMYIYIYGIISDLYINYT